MSKPLLANSPTVALSVNPNRELRADVIISQDPSNALEQAADGLFAKRGRRRFPWTLNGGITPGAGLTTQADNLFTFTGGEFDPDQIVDLVNQPSRVTFKENQLYAWAARVNITLTGGTAVAAVGQCMGVLNGITPVGATDVSWNLAAGAANAFQTVGGYFEAQPGDYLQLVFRWLSFTTLTATAFGIGCGFAGWSLTPS